MLPLCLKRRDTNIKTYIYNQINSMISYYLIGVKSLAQLEMNELCESGRALVTTEIK